MGTNYYWHSGEGAEIECPHCGETFKERAPSKPPSDGLHIGKSSAGWAFALRIHPDQEITELSHWLERWKTGRILDEYGVEVTAEEMVKSVTKRGHPRGLRTLDERQQEVLIADGDPTYYLCDHEFS